MSSNNQKKTPQKRHKRNWFLACFGVRWKATSEKKPNKPGSRKRWFMLCMPKIKVIIIRKKKVSFEAKTAALKATKNMIMLEAATTKVRHRKPAPASINQETRAQSKDTQPKGNKDRHDLQSTRDEPGPATCCKQGPTPGNKKSIHNKLTKESLTGVSIMIITLIIMSIWGRLCAILCISAWLYCLSILKVNKDARPKLNSLKIDMASRLHKKVVLEGILQRDHNS